MADQLAHDTSPLTLDPDTEAALAAGRWEPCASFASDGSGSPACSDCGWIADDHFGDAVIHRLAARAPTPAQPRRLAS
jgi:hypothetical protein